MRRLVLAGAGHAHVQVLADWLQAPVPGVELVLVSPGRQAPYSGMVPGWLAGVYRFDEICIRVDDLAAAAGARLIVDGLAGLDPARRCLRLQSGALLGYDMLSLNVGSTLRPPTSAGGRVLPLRPLGELRQRWEALLGEPEHARSFSITAVGGGAAGVEALLAVLAHLHRRQPGRTVRACLVTRAAALLPGMAPGAVRSVQRALAAAGVTVRLGAAYRDAPDDPADLVLWATGAEPHAWQRESGLAVDARGFVRIDRQLRSVSHPQVYAAGDCAQWAEPLPKAGVYAVRMGPALMRNLRAALGAGLPAEYRPQRRALALLATADGRAVASRGRWSAQGRWVWRWKDRVDRGFVRRFNDAAASS